METPEEEKESLRNQSEESERESMKEKRNRYQYQEKAEAPQCLCDNCQANPPREKYPKIEEEESDNRKIKAAISIGLSIFLAGVGHFYLGRFLRGIGAFLLHAFFIFGISPEAGLISFLLIAWDCYRISMRE